MSDNKEVFEEDVDGIFLPSKAYFQKAEAQMHEKHQCCADHHPKVVYGKSKSCVHLLSVISK